MIAIIALRRPVEFANGRYVEAARTNVNRRNLCIRTLFI